MYIQAIAAESTIYIRDMVIKLNRCRRVHLTTRANNFYLSIQVLKDLVINLLVENESGFRFCTHDELPN
jgi:hypothetical protein